MRLACSRHLALYLSLYLCVLPLAVMAQSEPLLRTAESIPMPGVKGRIDHFGIDIRQRRLFVAALGNDTLEVIDLRGGRRERSVAGFGEPQGVVYVAETGRVFVANGSADRVDILDARSLTVVRRLQGLSDADNLRYDAGARKVYVGYGRGALRALDAETGDSAGDLRFEGHPESFQLERRGTRIFVNVPAARRIAVLDRAKRATVATWKVPARANFPMALDEARHRLFVGARDPAVLLVFDTETGKVVARQPIGEDADDLFFDDARKRVYVICGEGRIDVVRQDDPDRYVSEGSVKTAPRARTGLFVPEVGRIYVAAPASAAAPARLLAVRIR